MQSELYYQIALTLIPDIGPITRKKLIKHFEKASAVFYAKRKEIAFVENIGDRIAQQIKSWNNFSLVEKELKFIEQHQIQALFITSTQYPQRLLNCPDHPTLLYFKGNAHLNAEKIISIIGTRSNSTYGKMVTEQLIQSIPPDVLVISGLAFGIDTIAHKAALNNELSTVGVLAHGLDDLYPAQNKSLAKDMLNKGGLLTEFNIQTRADRYNFPRRNRIVAGMSDATIVIETAVKGGSMITADLAFHYNRELFAVPGRINDERSKGCLQLIQQNKAIVYTNVMAFLETMGWEPKKKLPLQQLSFFATLSEEEQLIVQILKEKDLFTIDELYGRSGLNSSRMATALLNLEIQQIIHMIPGKMVALS